MFDLQYPLALQNLEEGLDLVIENPNLKSEFYSLLGDVHHILNNNKMSDESYHLALEHNKNNTFVLNNYSYYLALRGENLNLALEMTIRCNDLTQDNPNPSFLDTYAWVLYKLEKYKLARKQIEKALELNSKSGTLYDHYGDILWKLNRKLQARYFWKNVLKLETIDEELKENVRQKLLKGNDKI